MWQCGMLVPQPGMEPMPLTGEAQSPNPWTTTEFPVVSILVQQCMYAWFLFLWYLNQEWICLVIGYIFFKLHVLIWEEILMLVQEMRVQSQGQEESLKEMSTQSSILA